MPNQADEVKSPDIEITSVKSAGSVCWLQVLLTLTITDKTI